MRKKAYIFILIVVVMALLSSMVFAGDSQPASKAAANVVNYNILEYVDEPAEWTTILSTSLKTAQQKDLLIDVSLECGLYTFTKVKSKDMTVDTANAMASIMVQVLVDGVPVYPSQVHFAKRTQELTAKLQGQLALVDSDGDGIVDFNELVVVDYEEISLLLETLSANSFNFVCMNLDSGVHTIEVQAKIEMDTLAQMGEAEAKAMIGRGTVVVEEVRMIQDDSGVILEITE
jgi:hypothetical protein